MTAEVDRAAEAAVLERCWGHLETLERAVEDFRFGLFPVETVTREVRAPGAASVAVAAPDALRLGTLPHRVGRPYAAVADWATLTSVGAAG